MSDALKSHECIKDLIRGHASRP